jgi:putative transposase
MDQMKPPVPRRRGRPAAPDEALLGQIKVVIARMPTYGYRRVHAILRRAPQDDGGPPAPNHKRVWQGMREHGLLLQRHAGGEERRHDGRIAVEQRNRRWCSDGFEIGCGNGDRVRVAFALDCCDREAMSFIATTGGIGSDHVKDLIVAAIEHRFGCVNRLPDPIEWLTDNGSCYIVSIRRMPLVRIRLSRLPELRRASSRATAPVAWRRGGHRCGGGYRQAKRVDRRH